MGNFSIITWGLNTRDNHPPFYFWILNIGSGLLGVKNSTGAFLNIPFHISITLMIFLLCIGQKFPLFISAAVAVFWMIRYSNFEAGILTRQYSLLGLEVIFFYHSLIKFKQKQSLFNSFLICFSSLLGLLTHYQFTLIMGVAYVWISIFFLLQKRILPILKLIISSIGTVLLFLVVNPGFYQSFIRQQQNQTISLFHSDVPYLIYRSFYSFAKLFLQEIITVSKYSKINMVIFAVFLTGIIYYSLRKQSPKSLIKQFFNEDNFILSTSLLTLVAIGFLYAIRVFSVVTMSVKNLMIISIILFIVLAQLLTHADNKIYKITEIVIVSALLINVFFAIQVTGNFVSYNNKQSPPEIFSSPLPIIIDQTRHGVLPRNLWYANPSSPVYATTQDSIINSFPELGDYPLMYLISSDNDYGNTPEK